MQKKICFLILFSLVTPILFAQKFDAKELERLKKQYTSSGNAGGKTPSQLRDIAVEPPKSREMDTSPKSVSQEDQRHVMVHMKLANRNFTKKNYDKAKEEVNSVFQRDSGNAGGHFMLAVISARKKDYKPAWYHINIAKEKDSGNKKIDDFIAKLKTVSTEPQDPEWIPGVYNGIEIDASERTFDLLEKLLSDLCSQNITNVETSDYQKESGNKTSLEMVFKARDKFDSSKIVSVLEKSNKSGISVTEKSDNNLKIKVTYNQIKTENTDAKQINGKINDFINDLVENSPEIAIGNMDESEPQGGYQEIVYDISSREFSSLNQFFRKISPFATKFVLQKMELAYIPGSQSTIWKSKIKVIFKV